MKWIDRLAWLVVGAAMFLLSGCANLTPAAKARIQAELRKSAIEFTLEAHRATPEDRVTYVYISR